MYPTGMLRGWSVGGLRRTGGTRGDVLVGDAVGIVCVRVRWWAKYFHALFPLLLWLSLLLFGFLLVQKVKTFETSFHDVTSICL